MTNPIVYIFNSLKSLHHETELLEACEWDDKRVLYVKESLDSCITNIINSKQVFSPLTLMKEIRKKMLNTISEKELDICLHIVEGLLDNLDHIKEDNYEN